MKEVFCGNKFGFYSWLIFRSDYVPHYGASAYISNGATLKLQIDIFFGRFAAFFVFGKRFKQ